MRKQGRAKQEELMHKCSIFTIIIRLLQLNVLFKKKKKKKKSMLHTPTSMASAKKFS